MLFVKICYHDSIWQSILGNLALLVLFLGRLWICHVSLHFPTQCNAGLCCFIRYTLTIPDIYIHKYHIYSYIFIYVNRFWATLCHPFCSSLCDAGHFLAIPAQVQAYEKCGCLWRGSVFLVFHCPEAFGSRSTKSTILDEIVEAGDRFLPGVQSC